LSANHFESFFSDPIDRMDKWRDASICALPANVLQVRFKSGHLSVMIDQPLKAARSESLDRWETTLPKKDCEIFHKFLLPPGTCMLYRRSLSYRPVKNGRIFNRYSSTAHSIFLMSNIGKIVQIIGPVLDVDFSAAGSLPAIYNALEINYEVGGQPTRLICEVQQHLGDGWVRAVAMSSTEGLKRGVDGFRHWRFHYRSCRRCRFGSDFQRDW
jgi:hypothetical protein